MEKEIEKETKKKIITISLTEEEKEKVVKYLKEKNKFYNSNHDLVMEAVKQCEGRNFSPEILRKLSKGTKIHVQIKVSEEEYNFIAKQCYERGFLDGLTPAVSKYLRVCLLDLAEVLDSELGGAFSSGSVQSESGQLPGS